MNKQDLIKLIEDFNFDKKIELNDIPELDLYMDQVIQLFESELGELKRNKEDKILSKTMINNYAKAKLLMSIKNKKYSKEHLILMSLIYDLKGTLSISDIKLVLDTIVQKFENEEEYDLRGLYNNYLDKCKIDSSKFKEDIKQRINDITDKGLGDFEQKFLLVASVISISNMYRRIGEMMIDDFFSGDDK